MAVIGAIIATLGRTRLQTLLPHLTSGERGRLVGALGSGASGAGLPAQIRTAMSQTYVYALSNALYVASGLALLGALLAWVLVAAHPDSGEAAAWEPAADGSAPERTRAAEPIQV